MEARRRALGRGLGALISPGRSAADSAPDDSPLFAPIGAIRPNSYQPREAFDESAIEELASSIRQKGLLQPLLVRKVGSEYEVIAGERRLRAAKRAGLERVPVSVREADDREALVLALIENLQREDLNPIEEAQAFQRLAREFDLKQDDIAEHVGKSRSAVANTLRLLHLPADVRQQIEAGELSAGHARSLLGLGSASAQAAVARDVTRRRLSVRDTERMVRQRSSRAAQGEVHQSKVEEDLSRTLGTRVRLRPGRNGHGRIEIEYYSLAQLNGLVDQLSERKNEVA